ncbi:MAG: DUF58 domain-containing protein [Treponema sp.]|nr:DUF58 domain-containing protein [Treponema sp.]
MKQRVSRAGSRLLLGACFLFIVFLFTSFYVVQFITLFLALIIIASKIYSECLIRSLRIKRRDKELRAFRHTWTQVEILVENHGRLPAYMLALNDSPGGLAVFRGIRGLCTLRANSRLVIAWHGYCAERGVYSLGPVIARGCDPLGLFPFRLSRPETTTLFVYPAPAFAGIKSPGGIPLGALLTPNTLYEDLTRCRSLRPYHSGDEPRRVNWKASARVGAARGGMESGGLMVNEYEATISFPVFIFLNAARLDYNPRKRDLYMERAIEVAAALCLMASRQRQALGIAIYSPQATSIIAPSTFTLVPILERLAAVKHDSPDLSSPESISPSAAATLLERGKRLPHGTRLLYVGPDLGDEAYRGLDALKRYHLSLEYLVIDERAMPPLVPGNSRRYQIKESGYEIV